MQQSLIAVTLTLTPSLSQAHPPGETHTNPAHLLTHHSLTPVLLWSAFWLGIVFWSGFVLLRMRRATRSRRRAER
jgi:hypothetical protein